MRPGIRAVAFDLDGTLVDSAPDIAHALNTALVQAHLPTCDLRQVRQWIGDGPDALIARVLAFQQASLQAPRATHPTAEEAGPHLHLQPRLQPLLNTRPIAPSDSPRATQLRRDFDLATLADPLSHGRVYEGVAELLRELALRLPLAVVTNKPTALARAVLEAAGLLGSFGHVLGADVHALRKPAPAMLEDLARRLGIPCNSVLMVGDSPADMGAARAAGCSAALVAWGYGHQAVPDRDKDALWQVSTPGQLRAGLLG